MAPLDFNAPTAEEKAEIGRRKAKISRRIRKQVLAEFGIDKLPREGERTLITGGQGTGKSRSVAEKLAELGRGAVIWWLVPTLEKAEEQVAEYTRLARAQSMPARVVRGRGAPDPLHEGGRMCPRHLVVNRAASMGVDVQKVICDGGCPHRQECGFQAQKRAIRDNPLGLFVMASNYLWLPCPAPRPDIVVADESVLDKATERVGFEPSRIVDDQKWAGGELGEAMARRRIAALVRDAVTKHAGRELKFLRDNDVTVEDLKACMRHLATREEPQPDINGRMSDSTITRILDAVEAREIVNVLKLFRQIRREYPCPRARLNSIWFEPNAMVKVGEHIERQPRVFVGYLKSPRIRATVPVLALDGTGSLALNQKIFGDRMTAERFAVPRDAEVYQVHSKIFSRQSLTGCDRNGNAISLGRSSEAERLRRQVVELLDMISGNVLLVSYKGVEEVMRDEFPEHVTTVHFGGLRGLNSFEHCETAVILGRQQPSAQAIEALTRPFTASDAEPFLSVSDYVLQARGRRMRDPSVPNTVDVQVHPDPRCQAMLEQVREAEIVQGVDRVRPIFNRRKIFVLTSLVLDITVDQALPWSEMRPGKFAHAFARCGVLPLSPVDLAKAFPDLWKGQKNAGDALQWVGRKLPGELQIDALFGILRVVFREVVRATYRRKGQRGPVAGALVRADLSDPRSVLQGLIGELVKFEIDRPPDPPTEAAAPEPPRPRQPLAPLAAALAAEAHLLGTMPPASRPPDMLGMAGVLRLMSLGGDQDRAEWKAAA